MTERVRRVLIIPHPQDEVWQALSTSSGLAQWMYPNDFLPAIGHQFTFHVPPNPKAKFDGLIVRCEVVECDPPNLLVFTWSAGAPVENTKVSFRLESVANGTRLQFEHAGFDLTHPFGKRALGGANYGWDDMLKRLQIAVGHKND